ncbi:hypothetical protein Pdw03_7939 [Penicillium digitatum]|uniref:Uncharacterized protein n=1 Tax=Penicillium digitatum TaxID=36651 RepID=A0A7T6XN33_PENDI|nr:hypothetical protein Pdw03_7939 [Penicillium digitatum]
MTSSSLLRERTGTRVTRTCAPDATPQGVDDMALKQAKLTWPAAPAAFFGAKKGNRAIIIPDLERLEG